MVRHKSYSQTPGERELAGFMANEMTALGLEAKLTPVEGERVNAVGLWRGTGGGNSLMFNGHVDTSIRFFGSNLLPCHPWPGLLSPGESVCRPGRARQLGLHPFGGAVPGRSRA